VRLFSYLLPPDVTISEKCRSSDQMRDGRSWALLSEQERLLVRDAAASRRDDLADGRILAHSALQLLGADVPVIDRGKRGEPIWPAGVIGSITHCEGFVAAAVTRTTCYRGIGIDVEPAAGLPFGVLGEITSREERAHLAALTHLYPSTPWDRLLFCAKEACYKTWFPCERTWLGFEDAEVRLNPVNGTFKVELRSHLRRRVLPRGLSGRWGSSEDFIGASIIV